MFQPRSLQQRLSVFLLLALALLLVVIGFAEFIYVRNLLLSQWHMLCSLTRANGSESKLDQIIEICSC